VVAHRDAVDTGPDQRTEVLGHEAGTIGGVFGVGDHEIQLVNFAQSINTMDYDASAGFADNVSDKQNPHGDKTSLAMN